MIQKDYTDSFILNALNLPTISDLDSLSDALAISKRLIFLLTKKTENYYKRFYIEKRDGTSREILSPTYSLKLIQRWILKEILEKVSVSEQAMAYKKGKNNGIKKNAMHHRYSLYILEMDIKDFFHSIKRERVFYLFKNLGYNNMVSNVLTNLCTYNGYLPQGGVCSPYISNLICYRLDNRLSGLCGKRDILYTRYADDLTFSSDNKQTLTKAANIIINIIEDEGFKVNKNKTRLLSPGSHKKITGITVNDSKIKASKQLKRTVRAMIHQAIVTADYSQIDRIRGIVSYINSIEVGYREKIITYINNLSNKDYAFFEEIVEQFNDNKIFKEVQNMHYKGIRYDYDDQVRQGLLEKIVSTRQEYLENIGKADFLSAHIKSQQDEFKTNAAATKEFYE